MARCLDCGSVFDEQDDIVPRCPHCESLNPLRSNLTIIPSPEGSYNISDDDSNNFLICQTVGFPNEFHATGFHIDLDSGAVTPKDGWTEDEASKVFWDYLQSFAHAGRRHLTLDDGEVEVLRRVLDSLAMVLREESSSDANCIEGILKRL